MPPCGATRSWTEYRHEGVVVSSRMSQASGDEVCPIHELLATGSVGGDRKILSLVVPFAQVHTISGVTFSSLPGPSLAPMYPDASSWVRSVHGLIGPGVADASASDALGSGVVVGSAVGDGVVSGGGAWTVTGSEGNTAFSGNVGEATPPVLEQAPSTSVIPSNERRASFEVIVPPLRRGRGPSRPTVRLGSRPTKGAFTLICL